MALDGSAAQNSRLRLFCHSDTLALQHRPALSLAFAVPISTAAGNWTLAADATLSSGA
jgi:hypothetical protein